MVHGALKGCVIVTVGFHEDWTNQNIKGWVQEASGITDAKVTERTTHVVASEKEWERQGQVILDALKRKERDLQALHVVNFEWLVDSLRSKCKKREKQYRYMIPGIQTAKENGGEPRSHAGLMKQLYEDYTLAPSVEEKKKKKKKKLMEKKFQEEKALKQEREEAKRKAFQDSRMSIPELAAIFKKGSQKARNHLLSDNHHIYQDSTGFHYDITLTKVDTKHNTNERYSLILQIFESNHVPPTYALCTSFSGTRIQTINNVVVSIGSPWPTVFRAFSQAFQEKTGVTWDDRVKAAEERQKQEKAMKGKGRMQSSATENTGMPQAMRHVEEDPKRQNFQYHPPPYGPRGEGVEQFRQPKPRAELVDLTADDDELTTGGGNGDGPASQRGNGTRSTSLTEQPEFGAEEVERFKQAAMTDEIMPYGDPFDFGPDGFGAAEGGNAHPGDAGAGGAGGGATHAIDPSPLDAGHASDLDRTQAAAEPEMQEPSAEQDGGQNRVLGKRKDSATPVDEPAEKKAKEA